MLHQLLRNDSVVVALEAPNREAALAEVIAHIPFSVLVPKKKAHILELILQREKFGTTAIGDGVALPHCVDQQIQHPVLMLGISRKGISYPALDGQAVHLIFLMIFPESYLDRPERFQLLREAEMVFRDRFLRERLKICDSPKEAHEIFVREVEHLTEHLHFGRAQKSA